MQNVNIKTVLLITGGLFMLSWFVVLLATPQTSAVEHSLRQLNLEKAGVEAEISVVKPQCLRLDELREDRKDLEKQINDIINRDIREEANASPPSMDRDKLQAVLDRYNSPLNAQEYIDHCSKYPVEFCRTFVGIMVHESRLCTAFHKPIEIEYHNCSGWKSMEILQTKRADANGSWLRKFDSYSEFYTVVLESFYNNYWQQGLTTPETISRKYVGRVSQNWINTVNLIKGQL